MKNVRFVLKETKKPEKLNGRFFKRSFLKKFVDSLTTSNNEPSLKIVNDLYKTKFLV